ncbi:MAG: cytochrome b/b6 domain-containing protein [Methylocystaceae bacterium]|nr:cytochrome b/b6 domain-containing protein [Methylocystaceae bacterium]
MTQKHIPAWDIPTRLFHWLLVALIASAYLTYEFGDVTMTYHMWNGYAILTLCLYRLLWGLIGSNTARFSQFIKGPGAIIGYLKSARTATPQKFLGHNPAGALMVLVLLALIIGQGSMGLFTTDEILVEGPLVFLASSDWVDLAGSLHRIGFWVIMGFVALHVVAAFFYLFVKKENLIRPMVTGNKEAESVPAGETLQPRSPLLALICLAISAGVVWFAVNIGAYL